MPYAIPRYGLRVPPGLSTLICDLDDRDELIDGPEIAAFEQAFAERVGVPHAQSTSYGRMAFAYLLRAFDLPPGSEVIVPALTFWVVPEIARVSGVQPVFADVDPHTCNLTPASVERAITPRTRVIVATHLWGLPCDLEPILAIARRHGLVVIEDCAQALGATYQGQPVGTFGDAAFFSFQVLKPLNTFGGGMAVTRDAALAARVRTLALAEPWPDLLDVRLRLWRGRLQQFLVRPRVFGWTSFPLLRLARRFGIDASTWLWEPIRRLDAPPPEFHQRYTNVQAAIGLAALGQLDAWTARTRAHAAGLDRALSLWDGVRVPPRLPDRTHAYYQYCVGVEDRDAVVRACARRGVDVETLHVDVCPSVGLFGPPTPAPGADAAARAVQVPVYASLTGTDALRVAKAVTAAARTSAIDATANAPATAR